MKRLLLLFLLSSVTFCHAQSYKGNKFYDSSGIHGFEIYTVDLPPATFKEAQHKVKSLSTNDQKWELATFRDYDWIYDFCFVDWLRKASALGCFYFAPTKIEVKGYRLIKMNQGMQVYTPAEKFGNTHKFIPIRRF